MAEQHQQQGSADQSQLCCSVCLELLRDPVTIPCGHSYCRGCIEGCWEQRGRQGGDISCPQCRESFSPRPALRRNNTLAQVMEELKKSGIQPASPLPPTVPTAAAATATVVCDFCSGSKPSEATMSCLTCLASYCPAHLEPHCTVPVLKKHQLVSASVPLQEKMCTKHNKLMEIYCKTDRQCICYLCVIDEHKSHYTVSAAAEWAEEQAQLFENQAQVQSRFQEREKELNELVRALKDFKSCGQTAGKASDMIFDELIASITKERTLAKQLIQDREKAAVAEAEGLQLKLEEEISKLRRRNADLEQLSRVDDHVLFIQSFPPLCTSCESPDLLLGSPVRPRRWFSAVTECVYELRDEMEDMLEATLSGISDTVSSIDVVLPPLPKTREDFLRYCRPLTLDENSVHGCLSISQEGRRVTGNANKCYPAHADRFTSKIQVLCTEGLTERCYWEVSWRGGSWSVAVAYKDISRTQNSKFGENNKSWSLKCDPKGYTFQHNTERKEVSGPQCPSKIGVFLDYKAGTLSFYSVSDTMTQQWLHTERTTFTQPLHPGLGWRSTKSVTGYYAELAELW